MKVYQLKIIIFSALLILIAGCAHHYTDEAESVYGFWIGLWHGFILLYSLIGALIFDDVYVIGQPNSGFIYYVGLCIGQILHIDVFKKGKYRSNALGIILGLLIIVAIIWGVYEGITNDNAPKILQIFAVFCIFGPILALGAEFSSYMTDFWERRKKTKGK